MSEYEFKQHENRIIDRFVKSLFGVSVALIFAGILTMIDAIVGTFGISGFISGITWTVFGVAFYFPTDNFRKIVDTKGSDIEELMTGFKEIKKGWMVVVVILIIQLITVILDVVGVF